MINIIYTANVYLSMIFLVWIILVYGLRQVEPEMSRDEDIFFVTIGLFYSGIVAVHGWRLDPILLFSQVLLVAMTIFTGWENIRLRGMIHYMQTDQNNSNEKKPKNERNIK